MKFRVLIVIITMAVPLMANTILWENITHEDFLEGSLQNTTVWSDGTVHLGKQLKAIDGEQSIIWSLARDRFGNVYAGTGVQGIVYRLQQGSLHKYYETGQLMVTSIVPSEADIYVGTIPEGKIFHIADGKGTELATLGSKYIWGMKLVKDNLYVATGPKGILYRVDIRSKQVSEVVSTPGTHLLAIDTDRLGNVYVGSAPNGTVYKVSSSGKTLALMDFPEDEIRSLACVGDKIYIGANKYEGFDSTRMVQTLAKRVKAQNRGKGINRKQLLEKMLEGTLYEYSEDSGWHKLFTLEKNFITAIAASEHGVLMSTGLEGHIYKVQSCDMWSLIYKVEERQIVSMVVVDGKLQYFGAGNSGTLYQVDIHNAPKDASYTSAAHDTETFSHWGNIYWEKQGKLSLQTRTGNTKKPDKFWSDWSAPASVSPFKLMSPPGRYVQYRVSWYGNPSVLQSVSILYRRQNRAPIIESMKIDLPSENPRKLHMPEPKNPIKISWKANDPDEDQLRYRLWYRHLQSEHWQEITANTVHMEKSLKWDIEHVPNGYYHVKLEASDELENIQPGIRYHTSRPVLIDNHPPTVVLTTTDKKQVRGVVRDSTSFVTQIAYRLNKNDWKLVESADGIFDANQEAFKFNLPEMSTSVYTVEVRAIDTAGNAGYAFFTVNRQ